MPFSFSLLVDSSFRPLIGVIISNLEEKGVDEVETAKYSFRPLIGVIISNLVVVILIPQIYLVSVPLSGLSFLIVKIL